MSWRSGDLPKVPRGEPSEGPQAFNIIITIIKITNIQINKLTNPPITNSPITNYQITN
jgi:hypothetical protein